MGPSEKIVVTDNIVVVLCYNLLLCVGNVTQCACQGHLNLILKVLFGITMKVQNLHANLQYYMFCYVIYNIT